LKYFSREPDGTLYATDGFSDALAWDGLQSAFEDAGVPAPTTTVTATFTTGGDIVGTLYAYQRWLDRDGNPSNVTPVSAKLQPSTNDGSITAATNATPIVVTSTGHGLSNDEYVFIEGVAGNYSANGARIVKNKTTDTFELYDLDGNPVAGVAEYTAGGTWRQGADQINYASVQAPSDSRVVKRQILRTKNGEARVAYVDVETTNLSGTTFSSTKNDDALGTAVPLVDTQNTDLVSDRFTEPPDDVPFWTHNTGRMLGAGYPIYETGSAKVTNGSGTVTGIGTDWTDELAGRNFYVEGDTTGYSILTVNTSTQTITLSTVYGGSTSAYVRYRIAPDASQRRQLRYSELVYPEAWSPLNAVTLSETPEGGEITAIIAHNRWAYTFSENRVWRISYDADPATDGFTSLGPQRGAVNQRCCLIADDRVYALDRQGIYSMVANDLIPVSAPIRTLFNPRSGSPFKINWQWRKYFHATHDRENESVLFFVSLGGRYPRHALVYRYRLRQWDLYEYPVPVASSAYGDLSGRATVFLGSRARTILAGEQGDWDGHSGNGTARGTATSSGLTWIADSSASFASTVVGKVVEIVSGTGKGQQRLITALDGTTLKVRFPWTTKPDTTSVYQIGGINWSWRSAIYRWTVTDEYQDRGLHLTYEPGSVTSRLAMRLYEDRSNTPVDQEIDFDNGMGFTASDDDSDLIVDPTKANGYAQHNMGDAKEIDADGNRHIQAEVVCTTNGERVRLYQLDIAGAGQ